MARFRPSRLFRRLSTRATDAPSTTTAAATTDELPPPLVPADTPLPIYSVPSPQQLRKSSSLPKLRRKLHAVVAENQTAANILGAPEVPETVAEQRESVLIPQEDEGTSVVSEGLDSQRSESDTLAGEKKIELAEEKEVEVTPPTEEVVLDQPRRESAVRLPLLTIEHPTPDVEEERKLHPLRTSLDRGRRTEPEEAPLANPTPPDEKTTSAAEASSPVQVDGAAPESAVPTDTPIRPTSRNVRKPSIVDSANAKVVTTLIDAPTRREFGLPTTDSATLPTSTSFGFLPGIEGITTMLHRKIWVKRPSASATLVQIKEDDLVDDARDTILRKYANSLGKTFDAPDMVLHIVTRAEPGQNRTQRALGPEEEMCKTIDSYYPGGQTVEEALVIDTPQRRTPRPSPKVQSNQSYYAMDEYRPLENGTDYFPPMPALIPTTIPQTTASDQGRTSHHHHSVVAANSEHPRSISVLNTGQIPALPSPGARARGHHSNRPKYSRQPTSSPTIMSHPNAGAVAVNPPASLQHTVHRASTRPRLDSSASEAHHANGIPAAPPLPTPPAPEAPPTNQHNSQPPTPSGGPPLLTHRATGRPKKPRKSTPDNQVYSGRWKKDSNSSPHPAPTALSSLLDASVPPINVLIVEDNIINLRILEGLMKRLKVRWQTAMNGQIAVDKWRQGGYHLVLMDIQMPVMTGLQATKEIRRLERVNGIGVFSEMPSPIDVRSDDETSDPNASKKPPSASNQPDPQPKDSTLPGLAEGLFKSPVIIVALTASSLQSDRHEALAVGCNDFLTKPVNFVWLERKVKEWGCMQALIDFDGWRKWKAFADEKDAGMTPEEKAKVKEKEEKERVKMEKMAKLQEKQAKAKEEKAREERRKRLSGSVGVGGAEGEQQQNLPLRPAKEVIAEAGGME